MIIVSGKTVSSSRGWTQPCTVYVKRVIRGCSSSRWSLRPREMAVSILKWEHCEFSTTFCQVHSGPEQAWGSAHLSLHYAPAGLMWAQSRLIPSAPTRHLMRLVISYLFFFVLFLHNENNGITFISIVTSRKCVLHVFVSTKPRSNIHDIPLGKTCYYYHC